MGVFIYGCVCMSQLKIPRNEGGIRGREFTPSRPQRRFRTDTTAVAAGRRDGHKK
uniref:Uncharacterized protein n=1 Tax=Anguilla anguilla TaxID=7936 RepID=A0A0E9RCZ1_ANGAN